MRRGGTDSGRGWKLGGGRWVEGGGRKAVGGAVADGGTSGLFITFEGADGSGKSTQARRLAETLQARGLDVVLTREPGGTALGERLRDILLNSGGDGPGPVAEMLLLAAGRAQHVREVVLPALRRGAIVVSDRFVDSSIAYQAGGLGLPEDEVLRVNLVATGGLWPDKTIWLDIEPRVGLARAGGRAPDLSPEDEGLDRIEGRGVRFQERVRRTYGRLAAAAPERWVRIDGTGLSEAEVAAEVLAAVEPVLRKGRPAR